MKRLRQTSPLILCLLLLASIACGGDLPVFKSDLDADVWLRAKSSTYHQMAQTMDQFGGYEIVRTTVYPRSMMVCDGRAKPSIQLNDASQGPTRLTLMIFEFCNASQVAKFQDIAKEAQAGHIKDASEYAILHMLLEMESLHLHRRILADLDQAIGGIPPAMFQCFRPEVQTFANYTLPTAYDYIKGRQDTEYRRYYEQWFKDHVKAPTAK